MGLFSIFSKRSRVAKVNLIRELARRRIRVDSQLNASEQVQNIDELPENLVMLLPEARITAIVEDYIRLNSRGLPDEAIFRELEAQSPVSARTEALPRAFTLERYLKYRLPLEYKSIAMSPDSIEDAMMESVAFFLSGKNRACYLRNRSLADAGRGA